MRKEDKILAQMIKEELMSINYMNKCSKKMYDDANSPGGILYAIENIKPLLLELKDSYNRKLFMTHEVASYYVFFRVHCYAPWPTLFKPKNPKYKDWPNTPYTVYEQNLSCGLNSKNCSLYLEAPWIDSDEFGQSLCYIECSPDEAVLHIYDMIKEIFDKAKYEENT